MQLTAELLNSLRKILKKKSPSGENLVLDFTGQNASDHILQVLQRDQPCMISRFGSNELDATLRVHQQRRKRGFLSNAYQYVRGDIPAFWWDRSIRKRMQINAGFFPPKKDLLRQFGETMLNDVGQIDVLGSWRKDEHYLRPLFPDARIVRLEDLEPYRHQNPWTIALKGKKVLVVHPFEDSIQKQYQQRSNLFENPDILPEFELKTLKAIQSHADNDVQFSTWFDALKFMKDGIQNVEFDIAIIGAGAYGLPLAAFVKRLGKKAVHLGGVSQLLFGIKGQRWDSGYQHIYNSHWIRPAENEMPKRTDLVENGAYW